ncbi:MAG TPA: class I tRNA ligase family protein, partial [Actinocrinis sp.]|uniref:class I tRNA ligase family protein n=1 Tax=Actinocrinis sp. TaxID=1920516 RepID=UPI002DDCC32F
SNTVSVSTRSFARDKMFWAYEMHLQDLFDAHDIPGLPFGSVFGSVPPGFTSKPHCHQDGEIFITLAGRADVEIDGELTELGRGDMIFLPPFRTHAIHNRSAEPFDIVSVYWEDIDAAAAALAENGTVRRTGDRTLVFCPPVTPNGGLHLGHLSGPYLRADLYARALRAAGGDAVVITGADDHQSFVATAARRRDAAPEGISAEAGDQIAATLAAANVDLAHFYRPERDADLAAEIRRLFDVLAASPAVSATQVETPWCENCEQSLYQAFAHGHCPHCAAPSDGEICEACGRPGAARDLLDLTCTHCGATPAMRTEKTLLLDLNAYAAPLHRYLAHVPGGGGPRQLATELLEAGLGSYRLTRRSRWGMSIAVSGDTDEIIDPWVELALTQIINTARFAGASGDTHNTGDTGSTSNTDNVTVLGFDNTYFYLVLLPTVCYALDRPDTLPQGFISNRFLHLDDAKFSTSRRHVVWADDLLGELPVDVVRLAMLRRSPEEDVRSVSTGEIRQFGDDPLLERLDRWVVALRELPGDGVIPGTGAWTDNHKTFYRKLCMFSEEIEQLVSPDAFSSVAYVERLDAILLDLARFHAVEQSRRRIGGTPEEARTSVAMEYLATKAFAAAVTPVMPATGSLLWRSLGLPGDPRRERYWSFIPGGTPTSFTASSISEALWAGRQAVSPTT